MPCGLPTRPTVTRSGDTLEVLDRLAARRRRAKVLGHELLAAGPVGRSDLVDRALDVEHGPAELDVVVHDGPEGGDVAFVRHPHRAGVGEPAATKLDVRVAGDDEAVLVAFERRVEGIVGR